MKRTLSVILLMAMLATLAASCGDTADDGQETTGKTSEDITTAAPEADYVYPDVTYNNYEFIILNQDYCNWANQMLDPAERTGDAVSIAMYDRNVRIEERFDITITEVTDTKNNIPTRVRNSVSAGDDDYDMLQVPVDATSGLFADGYFLDLNTVASLNLDEPWWNQTIIDSVSIADKVYFATSDISLHPFEATWVLYFDEEKTTELGLDMPYQLVRDGEWTLDKLGEYLAAGANLNSDTSFTWSETGTAEYGVLTHSSFPQALLVGSGGLYITKEDGMPVLSTIDNRTMSVFEKIAAICGPEGNVPKTGLNDSLSTVWMNGRYYFLAETLGHINVLRDYEGEFGVLPFPKYDEQQDNYASWVGSWGTLVSAIATTEKDPERVGVIMDALAYDSSVCLMEPYYDTYLTKKGARNDDSAEMLQIVAESRVFDIGRLFGWTTTLQSGVNGALWQGNSAVMSIIDSNKIAAEQAIQDTLDLIE